MMLHYEACDLCPDVDRWIIYQPLITSNRLFNVIVIIIIMLNSTFRYIKSHGRISFNQTIAKQKPDSSMGN